MPRCVQFEITTDTSHFTPLQLQLRSILALAFNGLSQWFRQHWASFPELIQQHQFSVVILGTQVEYREPLQFFDGPNITLRSSLRVLRRGTRAQVDTEFIGRSGTAATASILLCPVAVVDPTSLAATPTRVPSHLMERLMPDEIDPGSPRRLLPELCAALEKSGRPLANHVTPFQIYRHHCEVADQWAFFEVPGLVGASREALAMEHGARQPLLRRAVSAPIHRFDMELSRPYFWFQPGSVESTAYLHDDRLVILHRLLSPIPGGDVHGVAVERFS